MDEEYLEEVLDLVQRIPPARVMTYGTIAEVVGRRLERGGPRQVGQVLARAGGGVPWWRVVNASGRPPLHKRAQGLAALRGEGCAMAGEGQRVQLAVALWWPPADGAA